MTTTLTGDRFAPPATRSEAEIAVWRELPRDERLRRTRQALTSPEASTPCETTMAEIWVEIEGGL